MSSILRSKLSFIRSIVFWCVFLFIPGDPMYQTTISFRILLLTINPVLQLLIISFILDTVPSNSSNVSFFNFLFLLFVRKLFTNKTSVVRQKGESQNRCFRKTKQVKFSGKRIPYPLIGTHTSTYQGGKKGSFFGKFGVLYFPETPALRFALFALLPTKRYCFGNFLLVLVRI